MSGGAASLWLLCWSSGAPLYGGVDSVGETGTSAVERERALPAVVLSGQLFTRGSSDPVTGAAIIVDGLVAGETDADGRFLLVVSPGRRTLQVQHPGYEPLTHFVQAAAGLPRVELRLSAAGGGAARYETVVRGEAEQEQGPVRTLSRTEITRTAGSFGIPSG